jgi:hypothetical protein
MGVCWKLGAPERVRRKTVGWLRATIEQGHVTRLGRGRSGRRPDAKATEIYASPNDVPQYGHGAGGFLAQIAHESGESRGRNPPRRSSRWTDRSIGASSMDGARG